MVAKNLKTENLTIWDEIARRFAAELVTSTSEVHFGVGIPGNNTLHLVPSKPGGTAIDLGCGTGENLIALSKLGYEVTGIEGSASQLRLAKELLVSNNVNGSLILSDVSSFSFEDSRLFDLILCIDVMHFFSSPENFIASCAKFAKPGAHLILSLPHPLDMIAERHDVNDERLIILRSYFPENKKIDNAYYWRKFAGKLHLSTGFSEYICRPSDLVNMLIRNGFRIEGMWEPQANNQAIAPCRYSSPDLWVTGVLRQCIPPNLIIKSTFDEAQAHQDEFNVQQQS